MGLRLFVAVPLDTPARDALDRGLRRAREAAPQDVRWLASASWHFTLQFLGDTREERVAPLEAALRGAAAAHAPFEIALAGMGAFPRPEHARVVWVGVARGAGELGALAARIVRDTAALGFVPEERTFHAHLTVARRKRPANVVPMLTALSVPEIVQPVREVVLYRSHLASSAARYEALARFPLRG